MTAGPPTFAPLAAGSGDRPHVLIAGGGVAGVETLLALRALAGDRVAISLVTPEPDLVLRPLMVRQPFGSEDEQRIALAPLCESRDVRVHRGSVTFVDTARRRVEVDTGSPLAYDALVLAPGARTVQTATAGALTFAGPEGVAAMRRLLDGIRTGAARTILFLVPPGTTWPLALYELALLTATHAKHHGVRVDLHVVTPERDPLEVLGADARTRVRRLLFDAGILLHTAVAPLRIAGGTLLTSGGALPAAHVVTLPQLEGPRIPGLPSDGEGFLVVDEHRAVTGTADIYAAGDGVAGEIKQGGLAAQQADAIAELLAARAGAPVTPRPYEPVLRAQLLTGGLPWYFRDASPTGGARASRAPLWGPRGKIAARYLDEYLATVLDPAATR